MLIHTHIHRMSEQTPSESVSLELVLKIVQGQADESKNLRKDIAALSQQVVQMKDILNKVLEKDKLRRSSSSRSIDDEYKNEKHIVISPRSPRSPREDTIVKRRSTDSRLNYNHEESKQ